MGENFYCGLHGKGRRHRVNRLGLSEPEPLLWAWRLGCPKCPVRGLGGRGP